MKKILFPLTVCMLALAVSSCTGYDDKQYDETIPYGPTQEGTFAPGQTVNLRSVYSYDGAWESPNTFVATVDAAGLVTAKHVGDIYLTGTNADNLYYHVVVNPTEKIFDNPKFNFGDSRKTIEENYGDTPVKETTYVADDGTEMVLAVYATDPEQTFGKAGLQYTKYYVFAYKRVPAEDGNPDNDSYVAVVGAAIIDAADVALNADGESVATKVFTLLPQQLADYYELQSGTFIGNTVYCNAYTMDKATLAVATAKIGTAYYAVRYYQPTDEVEYLPVTEIYNALDVAPPANQE